jgi:hypothetical protein
MRNKKLAIINASISMNRSRDNIVKLCNSKITNSLEQTIDAIRNPTREWKMLYDSQSKVIYDMYEGEFVVLNDIDNASYVVMRMNEEMVDAQWRSHIPRNRIFILPDTSYKTLKKACGIIDSNYKDDKIMFSIKDGMLSSQDIEDMYYSKVGRTGAENSGNQDFVNMATVSKLLGNDDMWDVFDIDYENGILYNIKFWNIKGMEKLERLIIPKVKHIEHNRIVMRGNGCAGERIKGIELPSSLLDDTIEIKNTNKFIKYLVINSRFHRIYMNPAIVLKCKSGCARIDHFIYKGDKSANKVIIIGEISPEAIRVECGGKTAVVTEALLIGAIQQKRAYVVNGGITPYGRIQKANSRSIELSGDYIE